MKRTVIIVIVVLAVLVGGWLFTGGLKRSVEGRITDQLVAHGLPEPVASCMGQRMADRLTLGQLRKLEAMEPDPGESAVPFTIAEFIERARRVDDPEVIEVTATSAAFCAFAAR